MAYGTNSPFGLRPLYNNTGSTWVERFTHYKIPDTGGDAPAGYNTSIFTGDLVCLSTLVPNTAAGGINTIVLYEPAFQMNAAGTINTFSQTNPILGVFQGCEYYDINNKLQQVPFWPANTLIYPGTTIKAYVNDDPNVIWEVQVSTPINAITANADFAGGSNAGVTCAPFFPGTSTTAGTTSHSSGIGSNFSIMGGGGTNFISIPIDPTKPTGDKYTNNPTSTMTTVALGNPVVALGTNPFGGNVKSGISGAYLCVSTYGTNTTNTFTGDGAFNLLNDYDHTAVTLPLKVIGYSPKNIIRPGKTLQTTPFLTLLVTINNHVMKPGTSGQTFA